jgi:hypothetical protein
MKKKVKPLVFGDGVQKRIVYFIIDGRIVWSGEIHGAFQKVTVTCENKP